MNNVIVAFQSTAIDNVGKTFIISFSSDLSMINWKFPTSYESYSGPLSYHADTNFILHMHTMKGSLVDPSYSRSFAFIEIDVGTSRLLEVNFDFSGTSELMQTYI